MIPDALLKKILDAIAAGDEKAQAALLPEIVAAIAGGGGDAEGATDPMAASAGTPPADPTKPEDKPVAASALAKAMGFATDEEAAAEIIKLRKTVATQSESTAAVELETRRELVGELVKLGYEFPATAWAGDPKERKPAKRLLDEPISELRSRVTLCKASPRTPIEAPETGAAGDVQAEIAKLSKNTLDAIKKKGMTPEQFIAERGTVLRKVK